MTPLRHLHGRLLELRHAEQGFALPAALMVTVISFALATAAVFASVQSQRGTARDSGSKGAIAAADAGANVAMLRLNEFANDLNSSTPCIGLSGGTLVTTTASEGWCPEITGTVGGATYSYRISSATSATTSIVASATADGVSRRIEITLKHSTIGSIFETAGVIGKEKVTLTGNGKIEAGVGTDGEVVGEGANAEVCGNIRHGVGKTDHVHQCSGYTVTEGNVSLPPVSSFLPTNIKAENSDNRITYCKKKEPKEPTGCESDHYNGGTFSETAPFNPNTGVLELNGGALTLGGENYWVCRVIMNGGSSELIMAKGAPVRIFFRTPEECGIKSGEFQIKIEGQARVTASGYNTSLGEYEAPGFYLQGSSTIKTIARIAGKGAASALLVYAPNTELELAGNGSTLEGAFVGKTVTIVGNGAVKEAAGFKPAPIGGSTLYSRQGYVECEGGAPTSPPNTSC